MVILQVLKEFVFQFISGSECGFATHCFVPWFNAGSVSIVQNFKVGDAILQHDFMLNFSNFFTCLQYKVHILNIQRRERRTISLYILNFIDRHIWCWSYTVTDSLQYRVCFAGSNINSFVQRTILETLCIWCYWHLQISSLVMVGAGW